VNLKDAMMKAFADKGEALPMKTEEDRKRVVLARGNKGKKQVVVKYGKSEGRRLSPPKKEVEKKSKADSVVPSVSTSIETSADSINESKSHVSQKPLPIKKPVMVKRPVLKAHVEKHAKCLVHVADTHSSQLIEVNLTLGTKESIDQITKPEVHEMALGLDFGTSSVKVVIGDMAADKVYAIPFLDTHGINAYLLPSRVFESTSAHDGSVPGFSLSAGETAFRDLKLSLLANPDSIDQQLEVIAFLALVIQHARAWFFHTHTSIYKRVKCLWQLRIGLPAATALDNKFVPLLERIVIAAWRLAAFEGKFDRSQVKRIRDHAFEAHPTDEEPEVRVIPEIAAQIFGFVASSSFDKKAANRYLMVDVGAGTVDASLFKVIPARGGKWSFEFYTAVVQPYGVSNLHAYRTDWWISKLIGIDEAQHLIDDLRRTKFATDLGATLPVHNRDYFLGLKLIGNDPDDSDAEFFDKKLMAQVQGSTLWRAVKNEFLTKEQLSNVPMFLCGGGARSPFYLELEKKLQRMPGYTWLSTDPWQLGFPSDLEVEDVNELDFDRLSVAYGLSKVDVGEITQAVPLPKVPIDPQESFTNRYIDKDQT
jgi:hypothetical protein